MVAVGGYRRMKDNQAFYVFECEVSRCTAEFYLNDLPVTRRGPGIGTFFGGQSNHLLVDGVNEISILVNPGPTPGTAIGGGFAGRRRPPAADGAWAKARLCRYPAGAVVGGPDALELASCRFDAPEDGNPSVYPRVATARADLGPLFGPFAWQAGPLLALDAGTTRAIGEFLGRLHASLGSGDAGPFLTDCAPRLSEIEESFGLRAGSKAGQIAMAILKDSSMAWWGMQPLDPSAADLRLCGRNRLIEAVARDWKPILREKPDREGGVGYYDMMLGQSGGRWKILR